MEVSIKTKDFQIGAKYYGIAQKRNVEEKILQLLSKKTGETLLIFNKTPNPI